MQNHDRRSFLSLGAAGLAALSLRGPFASPRVADGGRPLVLVQLGGGNDGLSMVVPYGNDVYHRVRPGIAHDDVLELGAGLGFHPALEHLRARFDAGEVAVVSGCGYPNPSRSHFKSYEIWHTADPRGRDAGDGWIGRLLEERYGKQSDPQRVVHVGTKVPYSLRSALHPAASFTLPESYRWAGIGDDIERLEGETTKTGKRRALEHVRGVLRDARTSSKSIRRAVAAYRSRADWPNTPFARQLRTVAALVGSGLGGRVYSVELGGFDTHNDQRNRHDNLMRTLDGALGAFLDDLATSAAGRGAVVLVFSEFGRRVAQNGSGGTDHGTAGPMLVLGSSVRGGHYGELPSLEDLDQGDLRFRVDFRSVYAEAIESLFEVEPERVLGAQYPLLGWSS